VYFLQYHWREENIACKYCTSMVIVTSTNLCAAASDKASLFNWLCSLCQKRVVLQHFIDAHIHGSKVAMHWTHEKLHAMKTTAELFFFYNNANQAILKEALQRLHHIFRGSEIFFISFIVWLLHCRKVCVRWHSLYNTFARITYLSQSTFSSVYKLMGAENFSFTFGGYGFFFVRQTSDWGLTY